MYIQFTVTIYEHYHLASALIILYFHDRYRSIKSKLKPDFGRSRFTVSHPVLAEAFQEIEIDTREFFAASITIQN